MLAGVLTDEQERRKVKVAGRRSFGDSARAMIPRTFNRVEADVERRPSVRPSHNR